MARVSDMRYAHSAGTCSVAFSPQANYILTCGADGEVRMFKDINDDDAISHLVGDEALALAVSNTSYFVAASGTNVVHQYALNPVEKNEGSVVRFTGDATALDVDPEGKFLVAGSEDTNVKLVNTKTYTIKEFVGHKAPILSVSLDTHVDHKYILSTSCDGSARIWNTETGLSAYVINNVLPTSNDVSASVTPASTSWHPDNGRYFAIPVRECIKVYMRDSWQEAKTFKPGKLASDEHLTVASFSPDGEYLLAASTKGQFFMWRFKDDKLMTELKTDRGFCIRKASWNSTKPEVAFIDQEGYLGVLENMAYLSPQEPFSNSANESVTLISPEKETDLANEDDLMKELFGEDDDEENIFNISKIEKDTTGIFSDEDNILMSDKSEDSAAAAALKSKADNLQTTTQSGDTPVAPVDAAHAQGALLCKPHIQGPFQPGSTPVHLMSRFMVWNSVGIVRCINTNEENSIEVEFHDSDVHHPFHVSNVMSHTMADLSKEAVVLACEANEEENLPSRLQVHHFASSDANKEWSTEIPGDEEVMALCCSKGWIAVATDKRLLRIFLTGGFQKEILSLPGPVVALAGHDKQLMVTCHLGMPLPGDQYIGFCVYNVLRSSPHLVSMYQPLPLAPNSELAWLGFTDEGSPCLMDSTGQVRLLHKGFGSSWTQICDTRSHAKGKSDHHFLIGVNEKEFKIRSILCKGSRYPLTLPKPIVTVLPFTLPLCAPSSEETMNEEAYLKRDLLYRTLESFGDDDEQTREDIDSEQTEALLKLFALACKLGHHSKAIEVCKLMNMEAIQAALKYASKQHHITLANKISDLACHIQEREEKAVAAAALEDPPSESQDMFADDEDGQADEDITNPILLAKRKKEQQMVRTTPILKEDWGESRNPFKKGQTNSLSGTIRSGIVFDEIESPGASMATKTSGGFGSRIIPKQAPIDSRKKGSTKQSTLFLRKKPALALRSPKIGKENASGGTPLKGFQLWLAENKESLSGATETEISTNGLKKWKCLGRAEKAEYKSPRVPKRKGSGDCANPSKRILKSPEHFVIVDPLHVIDNVATDIQDEDVDDPPAEHPDYGKEEEDPLAVSADPLDLGLLDKEATDPQVATAIRDEELSKALIRERNKIIAASNHCPMCVQDFDSKAALKDHLMERHTTSYPIERNQEELHIKQEQDEDFVAVKAFEPPLSNSTDATDETAVNRKRGRPIKKQKGRKTESK